MCVCVCVCPVQQEESIYKLLDWNYGSVSHNKAEVQLNKHFYVFEYKTIRLRIAYALQKCMPNHNINCMLLFNY